MTSCCEQMKLQMNYTCERHPDLNDCPDSLIVRTETNTFALRIHDGGSSFLEIRYCPWCGTNLKRGGEGPFPKDV